jgi:hypothetical protein
MRAVLGRLAKIGTALSRESAMMRAKRFIDGMLKTGPKQDS